MCGAIFWKCQQSVGQVWFQMPGYIAVIELRELLMGSLRALGTPWDVRQVQRRVAQSSWPLQLGDQDMHGVQWGALLETAVGLGDAEPGREQVWGNPKTEH